MEYQDTGVIVAVPKNKGTYYVVDIGHMTDQEFLDWLDVVFPGASDLIGTEVCSDLINRMRLIDGAMSIHSSLFTSNAENEGDSE